MTDTLDHIRDHYSAAGLTERIRSALLAFGPEDQRLTIEQLGALDQFHTRGLPATADLAELAAVQASASVLDVGSGLGGPARFLAKTYGCRVTGIDLSEPFVEAARYLTGRTGQTGQVSFRAGSALDLPFGDGAFDLAMIQHVAMNIAERPRLYRGIRRVLKPQGRLAIFDVVSQGGQPDYPTPWARRPQDSFLLTADQTREAVEQADFRVLAWRDDSEAAKAWVRQLWESGPPRAPGLAVVMGQDFPQLAANLGRALLDGRIGVLMAVFEAV